MLKPTKKTLSGFTLVELIVVITILVILGTIAFVSLGGYSLSARDSARISDITNITKALEITLLKNGSVIPPDKGDTGIITITASGTTIGYQGYAASNVLSNIKMSEAKDPLDKKYYTYLTNANYTKYQTLALLENSSTLTQNNNFTPGIDTVFAGYETRTPSTKGSTLGILLGNTGTTLNQPVQESYNVSSFTGVDLVKTTTLSGYSLTFSRTDTTSSIAITGTGAYTGSLFTFAYNKREDLMKDKTMASNDSSLFRYWDMETLNGVWLKDMSGKGNDGTINGGMNIGGIEGIIGKGAYFDGTSNYISQPESVGIINKATHSISAWIKTTSNNGNIITKWSTHYNISISSGLIGNKIVPLSYPTNPAIYPVAPVLVNDGKWHLLIHVWDSGALRLYIDGVLRDTKYTPDSNFQDNGGPLQVGGYVWGSCPTNCSLYTGSIDEVRFYNRALSDSEVQTLYNATK